MGEVRLIGNEVYFWDKKQVLLPDLRGANTLNDTCYHDT